jgi:phosphonate metabolism protein PhnN/1,5-bisphosphokinase (PRPP-forming)
MPDGRRLVLVVGASGVGKDSVLDGARAAFKADRRIVFVQRVITRPAGSGGEDHIAATPDEFATLRDRQAFAIHWPANGLAYGLPRRMDEDLAAGRVVVANVSRQVLDDARRRYPGLTVCEVTASTETLRARLAARGRETATEIEARLARVGAPTVGRDVVTLANDGALAEAVAVFVRLLDQLLPVSAKPLS